LKDCDAAQRDGTATPGHHWPAARQIVEALPVWEQDQPAVRELDDLLNATAADPKE
jgi:hypothetical protein